jgi:predicted nucleic acid-binding protein
MTNFLDTAIFMHSVGGDHPLKEPCRAVLRHVRTGSLDATTSVEVVQEIHHRYRSLRRPEFGQSLAAEVMNTFAPVLPVTHAVMRRVAVLAERYPRLDSRDLVHVATCIVEGIDTIISTDAGFDAVTEVRRIDPREFAVER